MRVKLLPVLVLAGSALAGAALAGSSGPMGDPAGPGPDMGPQMMMHHGMMFHHGDPSRHLDGRLAFLKAELHVKPTQENAWSDFQAAARKAASMASAARPDKPGQGLFELPVPARLDRAEQMLSAHLDALKTLKAPTKKLYDALDEEQKKTADELFMGPMGFH